MRVFLSHTSRDKPLLREVRHQLPPHIRTALDEDTLLIGDNIEASIRSAIDLQSDIVFVFVGLEAALSMGLRKALEWVVEREKDLGRVLAVPVVMDADAWKILEPARFRERKYLLCTDFSESGVAAFAEKLKAALDSWTNRQREKGPNKVDVPRRADAPKRPEPRRRMTPPRRLWWRLSEWICLPALLTRFVPKELR